jgi:hypothetical protein
MTTGEALAYWAVSAVLLLPAIPIFLGWTRLRASVPTQGNRPLILVGLTLQTASLLHLLLGIINSHLLGPNYSNLRGTVILAWVAINCLTALAGFLKSTVQPLLLISGAYLTIDWLYIAAVSSVV